MYYICAQIAKDMERWAKSVNAAKAVQKQQLQALIQLERAETAVQSQETEQQQPQQFSSITAVKRSGIALAAVLQVSTVYAWHWIIPDVYICYWT